MIRGGSFDDSAFHRLVNERIRFHGHDVERGQGRWREVRGVEGHDDVGNAGQCCRKDATSGSMARHCAFLRGSWS